MTDFIVVFNSAALSPTYRVIVSAVHFVEGCSCCLVYKVKVQEWTEEGREEGRKEGRGGGSRSPHCVHRLSIGLYCALCSWADHCPRPVSLFHVSCCFFSLQMLLLFFLSDAQTGLKMTPVILHEDKTR